MEHLLQAFGLELEVCAVGAIVGVFIVFHEHLARLGLAFNGLDPADNEALDNGLCCDLFLLFEVFDFVQESGNLFILDQFITKILRVPTCELWGYLGMV